MSKLLSQTMITIAGRAIMRGSQFITFFLLIRTLTPSEFGFYGILTTNIFLAATLGNLGLRHASAYMIGKGQVESGKALGLMLAVWPPLTAAAMLGVWWASQDHLHHWTDMLWATVATASILLISMTQGIFLGQGRIKEFNFGESAPRLLTMLLTAALALTGRLTINTAVWMFAVGFTATSLVSLVTSYRKVGVKKPDLSLLPRFLKYGFFFAAFLFVVTLNNRLGMFAVERELGRAAAGSYFAALRLLDIFLEIATAIGMVMFSHSARSNSPDQLIRDAVRLCGWLFWVFMLMGVVVGFVFPTVLIPLLGSDYASAPHALQILVLGLGASSVTRVLYASVAGQGRPALSLAAIGLGAVVNLGLAAPLVRQFGIEGAAAALVVGQFVTTIAFAIVGKFAYRVQFIDFFFPRFSDASELVERVLAFVKAPWRISGKRS